MNIHQDCCSQLIDFHRVHVLVQYALLKKVCKGQILLSVVWYNWSRQVFLNWHIANSLDLQPQSQTLHEVNCKNTCHSRCRLCIFSYGLIQLFMKIFIHGANPVHLVVSLQSQNDMKYTSNGFIQNRYTYLTLLSWLFFTQKKRLILNHCQRGFSI